MDAKALFGILQTASNSTQRLAVAETIKDVVMDAMGNPTLAGTGISSHPEMVTELGKALSPLLDAALQARDWRTRNSLQDVDACSILLQAVSHHLECCSIAKLLPFLGENLFSCLRTSGLLTSLPQALSKADSVLVAPNSPAPMDQSCTLYISFLLMAFSTLLRHTPNDCMHLQDGDLLAPLLLPAAQLAADVLRICAGPDGARILASNTYLPGYGDARLVANIAVAKTVNVTPALVQHIGQQMAQEAGKIVCSSVISNALRVADTFSIQAYNGCNFFMGPLTDERGGPTGLQETALAKQVLGSHTVSRLVAPMLFVMVKQLHTKQEGKAGVAAPATRSSGRTKQGPSSSSVSAPLVPAHHNQLANVLGLDLLAADEELFSDVTRQGPPPSWPGSGPIKAKLTPHNIDSTLVDPLRGLLAILLHVQENASPIMTMMQSTLLSAVKIRITAHLNDELSQAVLLTAAEVCALAPAEHGEDALRVSTLTGVSLFASWVRLAGPAVAGRFFGPETLSDWVDPSPNPLDRPELQELVTPVLRDLLVLLVPLLLPDCHGIPLPGSGSADPTGSKLSALMPQHIYLMAAAAGKDVLAQLLEEHPL